MGNDPAFLFYDGDAAKDVSHMNRLERGAYFDLIQAQRKFNNVTIEQAKKILGKDFEDCWPSLEMILENENGCYSIRWLEDSIIKRKQHAEIQRKRIQNYWDKKKKNDTTELPRNYHGNTTVIPLENEIEIENENVLEKECERKHFTSDELLFDEFRKNYGGTKRGLKTEYDNFVKKTKDHKDVLPTLLTSLNNQKMWRKKMDDAKMFVPEWKNLATWINQRCWEMEHPTITNKVSTQYSQQVPLTFDSGRYEKL